jgi:hypothetical protein
MCSPAASQQALLSLTVNGKTGTQTQSGFQRFSYSCSGKVGQVYTLGSLPVTLSFKGTAPSTVEPESTVELSGFQGSVSVPGSLTSMFADDFGVTGVSGTVTKEDVIALSKGAKQTINVATPPITIATIPLIGGTTLTAFAPSAPQTVGPFHAGNAGAVVFVPGNVDVTVKVQGGYFSGATVALTCVPFGKPIALAVAPIAGSAGTTAPGSTGTSTTPKQAQGSATENYACSIGYRTSSTSLFSTLPVQITFGASFPSVVQPTSDFSLSGINAKVVVTQGISSALTTSFGLKVIKGTVTKAGFNVSHASVVTSPTPATVTLTSTITPGKPLALIVTEGPTSDATFLSSASGLITISGGTFVATATITDSYFSTLAIHVTCHPKAPEKPLAVIKIAGSNIVVPIVTVCPYEPVIPNGTPGTFGYVGVSANGAVYTFGAAKSYGTMCGRPIVEPVVGISSTPNEKGYWEVARDGGIFAFGNAHFYGSMGGKHLNQPIVAMASTHNGKGYYEVARDGGIFAFGHARFYGSAAAHKIKGHIVSMAVMPSDKGYWEVASDGTVYAFGKAGNDGSPSAHALHSVVTSITSTKDGNGYWILAKGGAVYAFGDAGSFGSSDTTTGAGVVGIATPSTGNGYVEVGAHGDA